MLLFRSYSFLYCYSLLVKAAYVIVLHLKEMFGKDALAYEQISEDEDWGPSKRKRREKESDAASTLMTLYESDKKCSDVDIGEVKKKLPPDSHIRRSFFRIPHNAVEVVRLSFSLST